MSLLNGEEYMDRVNSGENPFPGIVQNATSMIDNSYENLGKLVEQYPLGKIVPTIVGKSETILFDLPNCDFSELSDESFWEVYKYYLDEISKTIPVDSNLFREYIKRNNGGEGEEFMKDGILVFRPIDSINFSRALFTQIKVL